MATSGFNWETFASTTLERSAAALWLVRVLIAVSVLGSGGVPEGA